MSKTWIAEAPSNIALIKYMGKIDAKENVPSNASLSWTLGSLLSRVEIEQSQDKTDRWEPLSLTTHWLAPELSEKAQSRFLSHWQRLKEAWGITGVFVVRSANNFPSDCGLASSASSFAALTSCAYRVAQDLNPHLDLTLEELANESRRGSGSSCRSFFGPWTLWDENGVRKLDLPIQDLIHQVIVVDQSKKAVSSSQAHQRVTSGLLFQGRPERAQARADELMKALRATDWHRCFEITWAEFWDMHALFETSEPPFFYLNPDSLRVLREAQSFWQEKEDGPLVTMDAGANVHFLWRRDQTLQMSELAEMFSEDLVVRTSASPFSTSPDSP